MSNHSVQTRGYRNLFPAPRASGYDIRISNGIALCEHVLEPILEQYGPLSISYGYISPDLSREIVHYQDPDKPSHHRWDLGAAADICVHSHVNADPDNDNIETAPALLAHDLDQRGLPYSRLITYSESPYICIAVSAAELERARPRKAFYENRYAGKPRVKPEYYSRSTDAARQRAHEALVQQGLDHGWRGAGYPTYHGGGRRQAQHIRISKYTMLSDWLIDLQSIATGAKNIPNLSDPRLIDTFYAVGDAYDEIIDLCKVPRMSIIAGFVSPSNPYFDRRNDWRTGTATFSLVPPEGMTSKDVTLALCFGFGSRIDHVNEDEDHVIHITVKL